MSSHVVDKKPSHPAGVTEVYVTLVRKNKVAAFREWLRKLHQLEATFPGFQKVYVQVPQDKKDDSWITLLQFDTEKNLENWLNSPQHKAMLVESKSLVKSLKSHRLLSSFNGWFLEKNSAQAPSAWKQSMLVLLALFPAVMLETLYLVPFMHFHPVITVFFSLVITVSLLTWPLLPMAAYLLRWWLNANNKLNEWLGAATVLLLYVAEIAFFIWLHSHLQ